MAKEECWIHIINCMYALEFCDLLLCIGWNSIRSRASSPRSIMTPIAPSRLTLGPDHEPPSLPAKNSNVRMVMDGSHSAQTVGRPGANQFAQ